MTVNIAKYIDHTALKPDTTFNQIEQLTKDAATYEFASVCVNPYWVKTCAQQLQATSVKVCSVVGFPLGATSTQAKVQEAKQAIKDGASEVDMVQNIGELKSGHREAVEADIARVVEACGNNALVKVILETSLLTDDEKVLACQIAREAGADFVKTSTGFSGGGANVQDVTLMRETVGSGMGVKASGGIRDLKNVQAMIEAGATRIGASSGVSIIEESQDTGNY